MLTWLGMTKKKTKAGCNVQSAECRTDEFEEVERMFKAQRKKWQRDYENQEAKMHGALLQAGGTGCNGWLSIFTLSCGWSCE